MRKLLIASATAPLLWVASASAMPAGPLTSPSPLTEVRTVCNAYGQCCATGSGQCFDFSRPRPRVEYYPPRRYRAAPAYGYYHRHRPRGYYRY